MSKESVRAQLVDYMQNTTAVELAGVKVYIAGPMSGLPEFNRPAFFAAEGYLKARGALVMNPAVLPDGWDHASYMQIAIPMMMTCDAVAFLPGWQSSAGAQHEHTRARAFALTKMTLEMGTLADGQPCVLAHKALFE